MSNSGWQIHKYTAHNNFILAADMVKQGEEEQHQHLSISEYQVSLPIVECQSMTSVPLCQRSFLMYCPNFCHKVLRFTKGSVHTIYKIHIFSLSPYGI